MPEKLKVFLNKKCDFLKLSTMFFVGLIRQSNDYSNPVCLRGTVLSRSSTQLVVRESLAPGTYFVHVENGDGRRSNWKKLVVK